MILQLTAPRQVKASIPLPTSKSISNRALLIAALCGNEPSVLHPALCDDTATMIEALTRHDGVINVGAAGTAMRFLTAYFATREGITVTLDGVERMRKRPIGSLVDALRSMGAHIDYLGEEGFPPIQVTGSKMQGGNIEMNGGVSSQFISAVMMILPAGLIYRASKTRKTALIGMAVGTVCMVFGSILVNKWILLPFYMNAFHMDMGKILGMITVSGIDSETKLLLLITGPFNLIKGAVLSVMTGLIYKPLSPLLHQRIR